MKVLSLFDGISCARVVLERAGIKVDAYYASEIDKYAIQISKKNYPDITQLGGIKDIKAQDIAKSFENNGVVVKTEKEYCEFDLGKIDLLIGGSPCQDLSIAKKNRQGLQGSRSGLFYEYVRILNEVKPKYFILENVASMPKEAKEIITKELYGIEPVMINAALVSAQNRKRLFWVGKLDKFGTYQKVEIPQPEDRGILLKDIIESGDTERLKSYCIDASYYKGANWNQYITKGRRQLIKVGHFNSGGQGDRVYSPQGKSVALSAMGGGRGAKTGLYAVALTETRTDEAKRIRREHMKKYGKDFSPRRGKELKPRGDEKSNTITTGSTKESLILQDMVVRKLTPIECERLQGLPDNYTDGVSNTQRYKALGNAFNVDVVAHIVKHLK